MAGKTHRIGPSLIDTAKEFASEERCHLYLEANRWPDGVRCLKCDHDKVSKFTVKGVTREYADGTVKPTPDRFMYQCLNPKCKYQFAATTGTIFTDTHLPLSKWMLAVAMMCNAKKGISAKQMERDLGVSYKTAWYLCHRIRKSMEEGAPGLLTGTVEGDETYVGGRYDRRRKRAPHDKQPVTGFLERSADGQPSRVRAFPIRTNSTTVLTGAVTNNVSSNADVFITDEWRGYKKIGQQYRHETVNHIALEYVRKGDPRQIHTNSIENFWSLFKRGLIGSYHKVSVKHLRRYLDEFSFRFNHRECEQVFALVVMNLVITAGIRYADLTSNPAEPDPSDVAF